MSQPTFTKLPIPTSNSAAEQRSIHVVSNLLTEAECTCIIEDHQALISANVTTNTIRDREVFDDEALAALLWDRLKGFYQTEKLVGDDSETWVVEGLNERFRLCRYEKGGKFSPHCDGRRLANINEQSFMSLNIYLNTVPSSQKGATRFITEPKTRDLSDIVVLEKVQPVLGSAALFRDDVWHDGEELVGGMKYLLRTDVMYRRERRLGDGEGEMSFEEFLALQGLGDEERGRKALTVAEGLEDSGKSEEAVVWYKKAYRLWPALERGD